MRRGISLLEVLIAIFVTAVGLLAVASLIPVGTFHIGEANKSIRGWDLAQVAIRQQHVRGMLDPTQWTDAFGVGPTWDSAFIIDPYFFATNGGVYANNQANAQQDQRYWFPYRSQDDVNRGGVPTTYQVQRLSVRSWRKGPGLMSDPWNDANNNGAHDAGEQYSDLDGNRVWDDRRALIDRLFTGHDDTTFTLPADKQQRPFPVNMVEPFTDTNSDGVWSAPEPFVDLNGNGQQDDQSDLAASTGDYSWFVTVSPAHYPTNTGAYVISTVICHKRPTLMDQSAETPSERTVFADLQSSGQHAFLSYTANKTNYLNKLKAGDWLLLTGSIRVLDTTANQPPIFSGLPPVTAPKKFMRWYKIINVDDDTAGKYVTLSGQDVPLFSPSGAPLFVDVNPGGEPTLHATLVSGVVNVFERTTELH